MHATEGRWLGWYPSPGLTPRSQSWCHIVWIFMLPVPDLWPCTHRCPRPSALLVHRGKPEAGRFVLGLPLCWFVHMNLQGLISCLRAHGFPFACQSGLSWSLCTDKGVCSVPQVPRHRPTGHQKHACMKEGPLKLEKAETSQEGHSAILVGQGLSPRFLHQPLLKPTPPALSIQRGLLGQGGGRWLGSPCASAAAWLGKQTHEAKK